MLDKLVISRNNSQDNRILRGLLFVTSTIAFSSVVFALIFSLFSQNLAMGSNNIELTSLITPTVIPDDKPEPPEPKQQSENKPKKNIKSEIPMRKANILRLDESPQKVPSKVSTEPLTDKARPNSAYKIGILDVDVDEISSNNTGKERIGNDLGTGLEESKPKQIEESKMPEVKKPIVDIPPPPKPKEIEKPKKNIIVSKGVINGKAKNLVTPQYPTVAKTAGIRGSVSVQVLISEDGKVLSANAVSGHPLLHRNAISAARRSTFTPTLLSDEKVKVRGVIIYNFQ